MINADDLHLPRCLWSPPTTSEGPAQTSQLPILSYPKAQLPVTIIIHLVEDLITLMISSTHRSQGGAIPFFFTSWIGASSCSSFFRTKDMTWLAPCQSLGRRSHRPAASKPSFPSVSSLLLLGAGPRNTLLEACFSGPNGQLRGQNLRISQRKQLGPQADCRSCTARS